MRIPSGITDQYVYFVAVDASDLKTRETGLSSFTVYRSRNGAAAVAMTTPTINETDASNMPGVYELLVDEDTTIDSGDDSQEMVFHITHAGMAPVTRVIELYRPKITAGETLAVSSGAAAQTITDYGLDHLVSASVAGADVADNSVFARLVSSSATADWDDFVNTTDSLQALRDRGDAAWTTGGGGSITDILNIQPLVPAAIDLANTATWRLGFMLYNALDDLPTTAEITPGTISIDRKAQGGTTWASVVSDAACSESAGMIYYDEVFDTATGYAAGDSLRVTFKSQSITVSANDYEITDATGRMFYTNIIADTPDVNVAQVNGSTAGVANFSTFLQTLNGSGQIAAGTLATDAITAAKVADGSLTAAKFGSNFISATSLAADTIDANAVSAGAVSEIQSGLATSAEVTALNDISAADVNAEILDVLTTDTFAEPGSIPAATTTLEDKISFLYTLARNKVTQTASTHTLRNDADDGSIGTSTTSDDGTTFTRGEWV